MVLPAILTAGASSSLALTRAITLMDKVGDVADTAGLLWDIANSAISLGGGEGGVSDSLSFLPDFDLFGPDESDESECFVAGTGVIMGSADASGAFSTRPIEDVRVGDLVLSRSEADADGPLSLRPVTRLFRNVAYAIQQVTLLVDGGGTEALGVTPGHSFWVEGAGWTPAELLLAGQAVRTADGRLATVLASESVAHPEGVVVYNFSVGEDHSYFVDDGRGDIAAVWVHDKRRAKTRNAGDLVRKYRGEPPENMYRPHGHHMVFEGRWKGNKEVQEVLKDSRAILRGYKINSRRGMENLHWAPNRGHTVTNAKRVRNVLQEVQEQFGDNIAAAKKEIDRRSAELATTW